LNLHAGFADQQPADWWIIHLDPQREVESFDLNTMSFRPGFFPTYQGDLLSFSSIPLPVLSTLSVGNHHFISLLICSPTANCMLKAFFTAASACFVTTPAASIQVAAVRPKRFTIKSIPGKFCRRFCKKKKGGGQVLQSYKCMIARPDPPLTFCLFAGQKDPFRLPDLLPCHYEPSPNILNAFPTISCFFMTAFQE